MDDDELMKKLASDAEQADALPSYPELVAMVADLSERLAARRVVALAPRRPVGVEKVW